MGNVSPHLTAGRTDKIKPLTSSLVSELGSWRQKNKKCKAIVNYRASLKPAGDSSYPVLKYICRGVGLRRKKKMKRRPEG